MASLRNSAATCARLLTPSSQLNSTTARCRSLSPDKWQLERCVWQGMSTVQHVIEGQAGTGNKNPDQNEGKKGGKDKGSYFRTLKDQVKNVEKMKENIANAVSSVGILGAVVPTRLAGEFQKYLPDALSKVKDKIHGDVIDLKESIGNQRAQLKKLERRARGDMYSNEVSDREKHTFEEAMQDIHESIVSYYDTLDVRKTTEPETALDPKQKTAEAEEEVMKSIFRNVLIAARLEKDTAVVEKKPLVHKEFVSKSAVDSRTRALVNGIKMASSSMSKLSRTEELCKHMLLYPDSRSVATKEKIVPYLLKFRRSSDKALQAEANEALALIGYVNPIGGQGIRVLTIDGGGTRGLIAIECLKRLEQMCNKEINQMFDYVCGVSTGALIAAMVFMYCCPLDECEYLYKEFSRRMFTRNKVLGTGKLVWNHAFYDTEIWENILKKELGDKLMIEFSRNQSRPKMSAVSSLINLPKMNNFMFRNYNLPPNVHSYYPGSCKHSIWEVIRASSAAPGYFEEFVHGDYVHQDGGLLTNNPTGLAVHESKLLWPDESFQCVISLGTGRYEPTLESTGSKIALKDKVMKIVDSATDTEAVHRMLQDLLPPSTYFRFNPYMSEDFFLDEIRPEKIEQMLQDSQMYLRKNEIKVQKAVNQLVRPRRVHQKVGDKIKLMASTF